METLLMFDLVRCNPSPEIFIIVRIDERLRQVDLRALTGSATPKKRVGFESVQRLSSAELLAGNR